eukprot:Plantae.Rhodophyta-Purpureofilum_apyrenoidigerum.ctg18161.p1 GENE.Plantae.Rhodophyta-Purpureofilum_apyrenoidigerum.ctg18161~~Plantae.Rhodophyta-Purpureofilum_apyrenoidigerum.ctg18161.p1  ORF type:complete len:293 (-),score=34.57 Plantae.Rhodophyta-Purpureofilum_apyrenoidigerum.ctg18161:290-1102(-)
MKVSEVRVWPEKVHRGRTSSGTFFIGAAAETLRAQRRDSDVREAACTGTRRVVVAASQGQVRTRQHLNPLSKFLQQPIEFRPEWPEDAYESLERPLHVDVGVAKGRFLLTMAEKHPERNFLGLEIRDVLVQQANRWRDESNLNNLEFMFCNANVNLDSMLSRFPEGAVDCVSIQFPDPWFKKRHHKRRVVQPDFLEVVIRHLRPGGHLYIVSDVLAVAEEMAQVASENSGLQDSTPREWLSHNPYGVETEREISCRPHGRLVYPKLFHRV